MMFRRHKLWGELQLAAGFSPPCVVLQNLNWLYARRKHMADPVKGLTLRIAFTAAAFAACLITGLFLPGWSWVPLPVFLLAEPSSNGAIPRRDTRFSSASGQDCRRFQTALPRPAKTQLRHREILRIIRRQLKPIRERHRCDRQIRQRHSQALLPPFPVQFSR